MTARAVVRETPFVLVVPETGPQPLESLAHELQSPVKAVRLLAEAVRSSAEDLSPEQIRRSMDSILRSARFMADVIARLTAPSVELRSRPTDLGRLVLETVEDLAGLLDGHPVQLRVGRPGLVPVDPVGIREVVVNLLSNAARYGRPNTPVSIELRPTSEGVALVITDRCGGIGEGLRSRVFEPFVRGEHGSGGSGLGLFLSRSIARAHGGDLTVADGRPGGCRFTLTLPKSA